MTLKTAFKKTASFYITSETTDGFFVNIRNTDRSVFIRKDMQLNEILDLIWGEGVERGKKKIKELARS